MATINLLPRKEFEITLDDGTVIPGKFGTWALRRLTDRYKVSLTDANKVLGTLSGLLDYLLCAVEYSARKNSQPFSYTDFHVAEWVDELGGIGSENYINLMKHTEEETLVEQKKTED